MNIILNLNKIKRAQKNNKRFADCGFRIALLKEKEFKMEECKKCRKQHWPSSGACCEAHQCSICSDIIEAEKSAENKRLERDNHHHSDPSGEWVYCKFIEIYDEEYDEFYESYGECYECHLKSEEEYYEKYLRPQYLDELTLDEIKCQTCGGTDDGYCGCHEICTFCNEFPEWKCLYNLKKEAKTHEMPQCNRCMLYPSCNFKVCLLCMYEQKYKIDKNYKWIDFRDTFDDVMAILEEQYHVSACDSEFHRVYMVDV